MFEFLFWVLRFKIFVIGFTVSVRNITNSASRTFFKEYVHVRIWCKFEFTYIILNIASHLKAGALK